MASFFRVLAATVVLAGVVGCNSRPSELPAQAPVPTPCVGESITIGEISETPETVINNVLPFARVLAGRLGGFGIVCGHVKVTATVAGMIKLIDSQEVDIYFDSLFPATLVSDATSAEPILRRWRNCDAEYYSVILATKASGITSIDGLRGHTVAMDRPDSTSGFVLPASYLTDHGMRLGVKKSYDEPVAANEVGIYFTRADVNTLQNLNNGSLSAAATDDYNFAKWDKDEPGAFVILATTGSEPRQAVLVRAGLDSALKAAIKNELLHVGDDPAAKDALQLAAATCKFDDAPDGIAAAFQRMRAKWAQLKLVPGWEEALSQSQ